MILKFKYILLIKTEYMYSNELIFSQNIHWGHWYHLGDHHTKHRKCITEK